jgi:hypothetical protein
MALDAQLAELERALTDAERHAKAALATMHKLRRSSEFGTLTDLPKLFEQAPRQIEQLQAALAAAQTGFRYDAEAEFASGAYLAELQAAAETAGLKLVARDDRLTVFPLLLKLEPKVPAVRVGRKSERRIRPSVLVGLLKQAQAAQGVRPDAILGRIYQGYARVAPSVQAGWRANLKEPGPVVPLLEIYAALTILPVAEADYPREAFACDLLRLNRAPDTRTRDGRRFTLPASTTSKGRNVLRVYDENGNEHVYAGIRFTAPQQEPQLEPEPGGGNQP